MTSFNTFDELFTHIARQPADGSIAALDQRGSDLSSRLIFMGILVVTFLPLIFVLAYLLLGLLNSVGLVPAFLQGYAFSILLLVATLLLSVARLDAWMRWAGWDTAAGPPEEVLDIATQVLSRLAPYADDEELASLKQRRSGLKMVVAIREGEGEDDLCSMVLDIEHRAHRLNISSRMQPFAMGSGTIDAQQKWCLTRDHETGPWHTRTGERVDDPGIWVASEVGRALRHRLGLSQAEEQHALQWIQAEGSSVTHRHEPPSTERTWTLEHTLPLGPTPAGAVRQVRDGKPTLTLHHHRLHNTQGHSVDLHQPFHIRLWDRPGDRTMVVELQQHGGASTERIRFGVKAKTTGLSLPMLDMEVGTMDNEETLWLWSHLSAYAALHGQAVPYNVVRTEPHQADINASAAEEIVVATTIVEPR